MLMMNARTARSFERSDADPFLGTDDFSFFGRLPSLSLKEREEREHVSAWYLGAGGYFRKEEWISTQHMAGHNGTQG
jgi:hypothetical protein